MSNTLGIVSDKFQFIIFMIPKNASSTFRAEFKKEVYHTYEFQHNKWEEKKYTNYKKFVFLRNPIDRFFSGYFEVYSRHRGQISYYRERNMNKEPTLSFLSLNDSVENIYDFLEHIKNRGFFEVHINKQIYFIKNHPIDTYFLVKNSNEGIQYIRKIYGLPPLIEELPFYRKRIGKHRPFQYYKEDMPSYIIDSVKEIYAEDILLYNKIIR